MYQTTLINFQQSLDTKTDPWQLPVGKFLKLDNAVFTTGKRMTKRNGYGFLTQLPKAFGQTYPAGIPIANTITTFSNSLVSIGGYLGLFSPDTGGILDEIVNTGFIQPMSLSTQSLVRRASSQTTVDVAIASNGLSCSTWLDSDGNSYFQINDSLTSATILPATSLTTGTDVGATMPRVFALGDYFVITYLATVAGTATLRYVARSVNNPLIVTSPVTISTQVLSITTAYDGVVAVLAPSPSILYLAWNASDGGGAIRITSITSALAIGSIVVNTTTTATLLSLTWDYSLNQLWVTTYAGTTIKTAAYNQNLTVLVLAFTTAVTGVTLNNGLTSAANAGSVTIFYEVSNFYSYDATLRTDFVGQGFVTNAGFVGTPVTIFRGVGIASKAIYLATIGAPCFVVTYGSAYQPTYFLVTTNGVIGKLAYSNGGGYIINQILPQINVSTNSVQNQTFQIGYLFKDFLASIANPTGPLGSDVGPNKTMGAANSLPVYERTGINLSTWTLRTSVPCTETGGILHMGCGFPWCFDGVKPVEHQFHVWPDAVEATTANSGGGLSAQQYYYQAIYFWIDGQGNPQQSAPSIPITVTATAGTGVTFTSTFSSGATSIVVSSATGLFVGQVITDVTTPANITAGTYITSISGTTIGLSKPTAGVSAGNTLKTVDQATNTINIPTLRLTYKTVNKVVLRLYRWSTANQEFFEVTSVSSPTLNNTTVDSIAFTDTQNDIAIIGNSLIYTTGGVVEDIAAPSFSVSTLFDDRMWVIDAENGELWYSKQVLPGTGVEFSDLFTLFVAPDIGAQASTGLPKVIAPMDVQLIVFKKDAIYYISGSGPDNTGANSTYSQPTFITSTVGCSNPNSVVMTDAGLMFQSDKGIWLLGRNLQVKYIGADVEAYNGYNVTSAIAIPGTTQVRFTISNGMTLMYDYYYGEWGTFSNTPALSATLYKGLHTYLNQYGQIAQETPGLYLDLATPVTMSFTTSWINMASLQGYQRLYDLYFLAEYLSPHWLQVQLAYNYNPSIVQSSLIKPTNFSSAVPSPFGAPTPVGGPGNKEQWRVHAKQQLCESFQLTVNEVFDPSYGTVPGAGFTMSGMTARIALKKSTRPIPGRNTVG